MKDITILVKGKHDAILLNEIGGKYEVIIAYGYDQKSGTWAQGHYFTPYNGGVEEQMQLLKKALKHWEENGYY